MSTCSHSSHDFLCMHKWAVLTCPDGATSSESRTHTHTHTATSVEDGVGMIRRNGANSLMSQHGTCTPVCTVLSITSGGEVSMDTIYYPTSE